MCSLYMVLGNVGPLLKPAGVEAVSAEQAQLGGEETNTTYLVTITVDDTAGVKCKEVDRSRITYRTFAGRESRPCCCR
jgi:hypothetical protein